LCFSYGWGGGICKEHSDGLAKGVGNAERSASVLRNRNSNEVSYHMSGSELSCAIGRYHSNSRTVYFLNSLSLE
ncbi:MAG: hypothetical protein IKC56_01570, partial [Clostridia bacterium]|nr:hypothetical protein [Clostridia bacterium]